MATKKVDLDNATETKRIRITLTSTKVKELESACAELLKKSRQENVKTAGPVRLPTKVLKITCRKTPCGEGSKTWDRYQMRIHKRNIDITASTATVRKITSVSVDPSVDVEVCLNA